MADTAYSTHTRRTVEILLRRHLLPRFLATGRDPQGGFVERFDWHGVPVDPGFRRVRVAGRQTYVAAHAAIGGMEEAWPLAEEGARYLTTACQREDGLFVSRLSPDGRVIDPEPDLYDNAFALFGLAWWYRASGEAAALRSASSCITGIEQKLRSPSGHGFLSRPGQDARHEQNPHMHLFEAALVWAAFTGGAQFGELATRLFALCRQHLFDEESGTLAELYDGKWQRVPSPENAAIEPGHHYEWVWLLHRYADLTGHTEARSIAERLYGFAHRWGHDRKSGLVVSAVDPSGAVLADDLRIWPNLEYLKARIARREAAEKSNEQASAGEIDLVADRVVRYFLDPPSKTAATPAKGLWIDWLRSDAATLNCDHVPASTLYHIMLAFTELLRHDAGHGPFSGKPW